MSGANDLAKPVTAPGPTARPAAPLGRAGVPTLAPHRPARFGDGWLRRAVWTIDRTGRSGLAGLALLLGAALFLVSTHRQVAADVEALRADLEATRTRARRPAAAEVAAPPAALRALPARADMPAILHQLFSQALQARLALVSGRYEVNASKSGGVVRHQITFPVTGPYPQIRAFIDETLATMPAVALSDLVLERKSIGDGNVEAQIRLTVYTAAGTRRGPPVADGSAAAAPAAAPALAPGLPAPGAASEARAAADRVVSPIHAAALFAQNSWYVAPPRRPPPPPPPQPPPPDPKAPPFPYTFVGSFSPGGEPPVFFLSRGDRVVDAHVGDRLDGVYEFESASAGQLVFVYLPLNIRQNIPTGATK